MAKRTNHTIGLDIGTSKVTCIVAGPGDDGRLEILGIGEAVVHSMRPAPRIQNNGGRDSKNMITLRQVRFVSGINLHNGDLLSSCSENSLPRTLMKLSWL